MAQTVPGRQRRFGSIGKRIKLCSTLRARHSHAPRRSSLRKSEAGVSEIVGALLLVVVVSSAAFGLGLFLHGQAKATEAQKNAELQRELEELAVLSITPLDQDFDAACAPIGSDGRWNELSFKLASLHLKESRIEGIRVNGIAVQFAKIDATLHDFGLLPTDPGYAPSVLEARQQVTVTLENVAVDPDAPVDYVGACGSAKPYTFFGAVPATAPLQVGESLHIEVLTTLSNSFERVFVPPNALVLLDTRGGAATSYILDAGSSVAGTEGGFLVQWRWTITCPPLTDADCDPLAWPASGRLAQATIIGDEPGDLGTPYTIELEVTDNFGMTGTATFTFTL